MKNKQRGDASIAVVVFGVGIILLGMVYMFNAEAAQTQLFNRWNSDCTQAGGVVGSVRSDWNSTGYECFIDGRITTLSGYEQYSTGIKN